MQSQSTIRRHVALMDKMADSIGVDLEESVLRGALTPSELTDAVLRCTACSNPEHCETWLDGQSDTGEQALEYCRNRALFQTLTGGDA